MLLCFWYICNKKIQYLDTAFKGEPEEKITCAYSEPLFCFASTCNRVEGFPTSGKPGVVCVVEDLLLLNPNMITDFYLHLGVDSLVCLGTTDHLSSCRR